MQNVHTKPHTYTKSVPNLPHNKKTENDKKCYNCNEYGHISLKCPKPQRKARCFNCQKVGHLAKDCALQPPRNVNCVGKVETLKNRLRGFGGGKCQTIGRCEYTIRVDGIEIQTEIFIVPDDCQADTIIIGRSALDQPNIKVTKERQTLTIEKIRGKWGNEENDPIEHEK
ncbi:Zinc knuckle [Popillia japonica]|uniref:Zinc knuckle n=1 Tax=Popillia japonica TaxID=7064 RepID=A0AAW1MWC5_POPJA